MNLQLCPSPPDATYKPYLLFHMIMHCYSVHIRMYNFIDILIFQNFNYSIIYGCIIDIIVAYLRMYNV